MSKIWIARRAKRRALFLPLGQTRDNPSTIIPLHKTDRSELDELVRGLLEKRGVTNETQINETVEDAELDFENRVRVAEVSKELRYRIAEQAKYSKLRWGGLKPPKRRR